jgi:hypothetical protein
MKMGKRATHPAGFIIRQFFIWGLSQKSTKQRSA